MNKTCYITIVNENYFVFLNELIKTHQKFSCQQLFVYTINFKIENNHYKNITFIEYNDKNLTDYDNNKPNKYIKNEYEKHKYITFLKPKILQSPPNEFDNYFFVDVDVLFTKNSDTLLTNIVKKYSTTSYPISVKYFYDYSDTHDKSISIFDKNGKFNVESLNYYELIKLYNTNYNEIFYLTTYCMFFTSNCIEFFNEVEKICFDEKVIANYKKYLPLGDETAFNYLYSKYNITESISSHLCYDIAPFQDIKTTINNINKSKEFLSFIHTKRVMNSNLYGKELLINDFEYSEIFKCLIDSPLNNSDINITGVEEDKIHFCIKEGYNNIFTIKIISLFEPMLELQYIINMNDNCCYWLGFENNKKIKDLFLIVHDYTRNIKDTTKII